MCDSFDELDYYEEFDKLTIAEQMGRRLLLCFELHSDISTWADIEAATVLSAVKSTRNWSCFEPEIRDRAQSEPACLAGIRYWLDLRCRAEAWAKNICERWVDRAGGVPDELPTDSNYVDWGVNAESERSESLWRTRMIDPLLYGEICLEVERICLSLTRAVGRKQLTH